VGSDLLLLQFSLVLISDKDTIGIVQTQTVVNKVSSVHRSSNERYSSFQDFCDLFLSYLFSHKDSQMKEAIMCVTYSCILTLSY
jgi:hypothetical protein